MQTFAKPPAARQVEARSRAKRLGVRVAVVSHARHYRARSQSHHGEVYDLTRTRDGWLCGCAGYYHTGCCKHVGQLERRAEREGWDFGRICPLRLAERHGPVEPAPVAPFVPRFVAGPKPAALVAALAELYGDESA